MTITGALVLFATIWFIVMFLLLPIGHQSQAEAGEIVPGTPEGAPVRPMILKKGLWALAISAGIVLGIWWFLEQGFITRADMLEFNRYSR